MIPDKMKSEAYTCIHTMTNRMFGRTMGKQQKNHNHHQNHAE